MTKSKTSGILGAQGGFTMTKFEKTMRQNIISLVWQKYLEVSDHNKQLMFSSVLEDINTKTLSCLLSYMTWVQK